MVIIPIILNNSINDIELKYAIYAFIISNSKKELMFAFTHV